MEKWKQAVPLAPCAAWEVADRNPPEENNDLNLLWSAVHAVYAFNLGSYRRSMTFYSMFWKKARKFMKSFLASLIKLQNSDIMWLLLPLEEKQMEDIQIMNES